MRMTELLRTDNTILRTQCDRRRELIRTKRETHVKNVV